MIKDCGKDSKLDSSYSEADLAQALKQLPTDIDEYTDCRDVIRRAQLHAGSSGKGGGSSSGGSGALGSTTGGTGATGAGGAALPAGQTADQTLAAATPEERAAVEKAVAGGQDPVQVAGVTLHPGSLGVGDVTKRQTIPTPLIVVLIMLGLSAAGGIAVARVRKRQ